MMSPTPQTKSEAAATRDRAIDRALVEYNDSINAAAATLREDISRAREEYFKAIQAEKAKH